MEILRQFRDVYLLPTRAGHVLVDAYYRYSPPMAEFLRGHDGLRAVVRFGLMPVVGVSYVALNTSLAQKMVILLVFMGFAAGICWVKRERRRARSA